MKEHTIKGRKLRSDAQCESQHISIILLVVLSALVAAMLTACLGTHAPSGTQGQAGEEIPGDDFHYEMALWYMYGCNNVNLRAARSELEMIGRDYEKYPDVERMLGVIREYEDVIAHDRDYHGGVFRGGIMFRWNGMLINGGYAEITVEGEEPVRIDEAGKANEWYDWDFALMPMLDSSWIEYDAEVGAGGEAAVTVYLRGWAPDPDEWAAWVAAGNAENAGVDRYEGDLRAYYDSVTVAEADFGKTVAVETENGLSAEVEFTPDVCAVALFEEFTAPDGRPARAEVRLSFVWEEYDR